MVITLSKGASFRPHYAMLGMKDWQNKWLAYIHDPYPFHLYPKPYRYRQIGYIQKEAFFKRMSEKAKWFAFPSKLLMEWMAYDFPKMLSKGVVIPHQISAEKQEIVFVSEYIDENKFTLVHAGALMSARQPFGLIKGFLKFLETTNEAKSDAELLFIGSSDYTQEMLSNVSNNVPQIRFKLSKIPYIDALQIQKRASVNIIIESNFYVSPFLPGKFPHCVVANKPILHLGPYQSEVRSLLGNDYPYWCENEDSENIYSKISALYSEWKKFRELSLINHYNLMKYLDKSYLSKQIDMLLEMHE
jgi:hypothetical protein